MRKETNLEAVKEVARSLVYIDEFLWYNYIVGFIC